MGNYEEMEAQKTKLLIATERQMVVEKEAETERKRATIDAQKVADVSAVHMKNEIAVKKSEQEIQRIQDEIHLQHEKALSDAEHYRALKRAEANKARLTPEFLEWQHIKSLANNSKIYFGEKIPALYVDRGVTPAT